MTPEEYVKFDAIGLAKLIKQRDVSVKDVHDAAQAVISKINPQINSVIETWPERAAGKCDAAIDTDGPLAGVPFLLKDVGGSEPGVRHECGSRIARDMAPDVSESAVMRRYREAGMVSIGRTTSPEFAFNITTENVLHGATRNPWNLEYSAGGSSGGAAASVASGMVPIAEANDGGGSIRIPASACGLFGLKPSRGRISMAPFAAEYLCGLSATHVVSRSVRDSAAALDAAAGAEPGDPYPVRQPERLYSEEITRPLGRLRVALMTDVWTGKPLHPECLRAVEDAARLLEAMGVVVEYKSMSLGMDWQSFMIANARLWCGNIAPWVDMLAAYTDRPISEDMLERASYASYQYGKSLTGTEMLEAMSAMNLVSRTVGQFFETYDMVLTPMLPDPPAQLGTYDANAEYATGLEWTEKILSASPFTPVFNVTGQPAVSVPWSISSAGLPIGIQLAANMGDEAVLFRAGAAIEQARPWGKDYPFLKAMKPAYAE